jgi:hypothetical protein
VPRGLSPDKLTGSRIGVGWTTRRRVRTAATGRGGDPLCVRSRTSIIAIPDVLYSECWTGLAPDRLPQRERGLQRRRRVKADRVGGQRAPEDQLEALPTIKALSSYTISWDLQHRRSRLVVSTRAAHSRIEVIRPTGAAVAMRQMHSPWAIDRHAITIAMTSAGTTSEACPVRRTRAHHTTPECCSKIRPRDASVVSVGPPTRLV